MANELLFQKLKEMHPEEDDATLQAMADKFASQEPDMTQIAPPEPATSYDVHVSDNTVTQDGAPESLPTANSLSPYPTSGNFEPNPLPKMEEPAPEAAAPVAPVAPVAAPVEKEKPMDMSAVTDSASKDNEARNKMLEDEAHKKKMGLIPNIAGGIADTIGGAASAFGVHVPTDTQDTVIASQKANTEQNKADFETKTQNDPNSDISKAYRQMVLQIAPDLAKNSNFTNMSAKSIGDKLPLIDTMMKARAQEDAKKLGMAQMKANKDISLQMQKDQHQDRLEQNAKQMVSNLRGDKSLARAEEQRDAAIVAYNRLEEIRKSGKEPNPIDYTDVLGQLYKARTGSSPTEKVLEEIRQSTAKGDLAKAYTYITGNQAPATTRDITNSLIDMAKSMGDQADKFHEGYMKSHLIKPSGLDEEKWTPILQTGRGVSFKDAIGSSSANTNSEDQQAIEWARQNPTDPRASQIFKLHGVK